MKQQVFTAVVKQEDDSWIGWIEEVPGVNCQEATREELVETLRVTLEEAIELNRQEARGAAGKGRIAVVRLPSSALPPSGRGSYSRFYLGWYAGDSEDGRRTYQTLV